MTGEATKNIPVGQFPPAFIGISDAMRATRALIKRVARFDATILLRGESGVGKDVAAQLVHYYSSRRNGAYVAVNAAAFPEQLIESEVFGYEQGAFTGAERMKIGKVELADKGTFFLDEIGDLPLPLQVKLLRLLQDKSYERLGGVKTLTADVRFIAATNKPLEELIAQQQFREDLYYRLNVITIQIPPLRERKEDIPGLVRYFFKKHIGHIPVIHNDVYTFFQSFEWRGNVRELAHTVQRVAIFLADKKEVTVADVTPHVKPSVFASGDGMAKYMVLPYKQAVALFRTDYVSYKLREYRNKQVDVAKAMKVSTPYLSKILRELGIKE